MLGDSIEHMITVIAVNTLAVIRLFMRIAFTVRYLRGRVVTEAWRIAFPPL